MTVTGDATDEPDETVKVVLSGPVNATLGAAAGTGTIRDDDAAPSVTLALSSSSISENGGVSTVTARLSHRSSQPTTVTVTASAGLHTASSDFRLSTNRTLTVAAGATASAGVVTVSAVNDAEDAANDKTVTVSATAANGQGIAGNPSPVTLTIEDDDVDLKPTFGDQQIASRLWPVSTVIPRLTLPRATGGDGTLTYALSPALPSWLSRNGFFVTGTTPDAPTNQKEYVWTATDEDGDAATLPFLVAVIASGDPPRLVNPPGIVVNTGNLPSLSISSPQVAEGASGSTATLSYKVTLSAESAAEVTVGYADAGTGTASSGADYTALSSGTLTLAPGVTSATVSVTVTGDGVDEPDETVELALSGPVNAQVPVAGRTGTGTIEDDDAAPDVTLALADTAIVEDGGATTASATLSHPSSAATTVTVTAVAGFYTVGSDATIVIAAGDTANATDTATIAAVNDDVDNVGDRSVTVTATASNGQAAADSQTMAVTGASLTLTDDEATPAATLRLSPETIPENGGAAMVTATLSGESSAAVTLTVAASAGTNAVDGDFTLSNPATLTIAAGSTASTGVVTVTANNDSTDAPDKSVTVSATVSGDSGVSGPAAVTLTITDDDDAPDVTLALSSSIPENGGATSVSATLSHASSAATTVTVTGASGFYTVGSDTTIVIAAGDTASATDTATINAVNDDVHQGSGGRSTTVTATVANDQGTGRVTGAALALTDDEALPTVKLVLSPASISETGGVSSVTATLSGASSEAVTVTVEAAAGTGAVGADFALSAAKTLTIAAGDTTSIGAVTVTANGNDVDSPDKRVAVSGTASGGNGVAAPADVTLTIEDDEALPTVTLALSSASISESGGVASVTATLSDISSEAVKVTVEAAAGTGAVGADFALSAAKTLTIAAGDTTSVGAVTVTANGNDVDSPDKRVTVSGTVTGGNGVAAPSAVMLTLTDDEATPTATLKLSSSSISESGGVSTVTATLSGKSSAAVTLTVSASGSGFTLSSAKTLTIGAGSTASAGAVTVTAVADTMDSPDKSVTVSATASGGGVANPTAVTLTITDDDAAPDVTLALAASSIPEDGGTTTVSAALSRPSSAATTITVTALEGAYTVDSVDATIVIAAGATANAADTATITAVDDAIDNVDNRTVTVTGTASNGQAAAESETAAVTGASLTLTDDEGAPAATLSLSSSSILENGGVATVTATLSGKSSAAVTLTVSASGDGFTLSSAKTLTIGAGSTVSAGAVTVTAVADTTDGPDKSVTVSATASGGGVSDPSTVTLTITDDETLPTVSLVLSSSSISENGGVATVTARLSGKSSAAVTVTVSASPGSGTDFTQTGTTLTIASESTTSTGAVTVRGADDSTAEGSEQITVSGTAAGGNGVADPSSLTLMLTDDDVPETTLVLSSASIAEAGSVATVTATLDRKSSVAVTITVSASPGSGTDFGLSAANTLTIAVNATTSTGLVTVTGVDDDTDAPNKSVTVSGAASDGLGLANDPPAVTLTITDDDAAPETTLALSSASIAEAGGVTTVTATLDRPSSQPTTVTVSASPGSGTDFTLSGTTLTVAAGATASTGAVTLTAVDNAKDEPDKDVTVSGTSANGHGKTDPAAVTLTITDDDGSVSPPSALTADAGEDKAVDEGAAVTLSGSARGWDPADGAPAWAWAQTGGTPAVTLTGAATASPSFTAPQVSGVTVLTFRLTVTAGGVRVSDTVDITVMDRSGASVSDATPDSAPTFGDAVVADRSWVVNAALASFVLPEATGGDGVLTYSLSPALPAGVTRDAATREVAGAPTSVLARTTYTWTATDADGDRATLSFAIAVEADTAPVFEPDGFPAQTYTEGVAIAPLVLPAATGGNGPLAYGLRPALPAGLAFDPATRTVSGTPSAATAALDYTLTATDTDGDRASLSFAIEVWPRITLQVSDAVAEEGEEIVFVVTLSPAPPRAVTLRFSATPGSATPGDDYEVARRAPGAGFAQRTGASYADASGRGFTVSAGQRSVRVAVRTVDDREDEPDETFTLNAASLPSTPVAVSPATATGTIVDNDHRARTRAFAAVLASFGRTVAAEAVGALTARFADADASDRVTLGGHALSLAAAGAGGEEPFEAAKEARGLADDDDNDGLGPATLRELAAQSAFTLSLGEPAGGGARAWTFWGRAGTADFANRAAADLETDGAVFTGFLGADVRLRRNFLAGVSVSRSKGDMGYRLAEERAAVEATLTGVFPYAHWQASAGVGVWALAGAGWGEAALTDAAGSAHTAIAMRMAALGGRKELGDEGGVAWALKGDGLAVEMESDEAAGLHATRPATQRLRLLVEGAADWAMSEHGRLRPRLEFGGRWDGGDFGAGFGAEAGGGVAYADTRLGLEAEARGRYLLAHEAAGFAESGAGFSLRFDPGGDGVGPWFGLAPQWGAPEGGASSLWEALPAEGAAAPARRFGLEAGWRFAETLGLSATFEREAGAARGYGLGGRWTPPGAPGISLEAEATRRESETNETDNRIGFQIRMTW